MLSASQLKLELLLLAFWLPCALYTFVWHRPRAWSRLVAPTAPITAFRNAAVLLKAALWALLAVNASVESDVALVLKWWPVYAVAVALVAFGQLLNYRVFALLGTEGVYYGCRFGAKIEWVTAWPYSHISNPQYVGCMLTLLGGSLFLPFWATVNGLASYAYLCHLERYEPPMDEDAQSRFEELLNSFRQSKAPEEAPEVREFALLD
jgi:methylene-fatty-acyl-phospholipid synthase